jgi:hypothetical protein
MRGFPGRTAILPPGSGKNVLIIAKAVVASAIITAHLIFDYGTSGARRKPCAGQVSTEANGGRQVLDRENVASSAVISPTILPHPSVSKFERLTRQQRWRPDQSSGDSQNLRGKGHRYAQPER